MKGSDLPGCELVIFYLYILTSHNLFIHFSIMPRAESLPPRLSFTSTLKIYARIFLPQQYLLKPPAVSFTIWPCHFSLPPSLRRQRARMYLRRQNGCTCVQPVGFPSSNHLRTKSPLNRATRHFSWLIAKLPSRPNSYHL
jgi:hypothetical protein